MMLCVAAQIHFWIPVITLGLYSLRERTSYRKISRSLGAARFGFKFSNRFVVVISSAYGYVRFNMDMFCGTLPCMVVCCVSIISLLWLPMIDLPIYHYCDVMMGAMTSQITRLTIVYLTLHSGADQRKYQSFASLAFVRGIHRWPVNCPHKWPVTRKMFSFDGIIIFSLFYSKYIHIEQNNH